jgi:diguanylate cyclase (GGDEF)-like protein
VVNDKYGHAHGDKVLRSIVGLIDQRIRGVDMLFRLGGEEFVVLLSEVGAQTAAKIAEELRVGISRMDVSPAPEVTVSIGVCDVTQVNSADNWLKQVDEAMYSAKQQGRNRVVAVDTSKVPDPLIASNLPIWR